MQTLLEILNGQLPDYPTDYAADDYEAKRDARAAAEHARARLEDEIAAARVRARAWDAPASNWTRNETDPRFVEWRNELWREARRELAPALGGVGPSSGLRTPGPTADVCILALTRSTSCLRLIVEAGLDA